MQRMTRPSRSLAETTCVPSGWTWDHAIFGLPPTARTFVETWSHVQPDGTHVVSARLRDGRVIRCIGPQGPDARYPGAPPDPYRELRAWIRAS